MRAIIVVMFLLISQAAFSIPSDQSSLQMSALVGIGQYSADNANLSSHAVVEARLNWMFSPVLGIELGVQSAGKAKDSGDDIKGHWESSLETQDALLGLRLTHRLTKWAKPFLRVGISRGQTKLKVNESFYGLRVGGTRKANFTGNGYYAGFGVLLFQSNSIEFGLEGAHHWRPDQFADQSDYAFDLNAYQYGAQMTFSF